MDPLGPLHQEPPDRKPWDRHRSFLRELTRSAGTTAPPGVGLRWGGRAAGRASTTGGGCPAELAHLVGRAGASRRWARSDGLDRAITTIGDGLRDCSLILDRHREPAERVAPVLNAFACRAYLPPAADFDTDGAVPLHTCVDLRFAGHHGSIWLHLTVSLWSARPSSPEHLPPPGPPDTPRDARTVGSGGVAQYQRAIAPPSRRIEGIVARNFVPNDPIVLRGDGSLGAAHYRPPRFWVAACNDPPTPEGPTHPRPCALIDELTGAVLQVRDASSSPLVSRHAVTATADLAANALPITVFRRLVPTGPDAIPSYVLLPARSARWADQEDAVRELIHRISEEDALLAAELFDGSTELLYRFYPVLDRCFPATTRPRAPLVSDADLMLALGSQLGVVESDRRVVEWWGTQLRHAPSARAALRAIERTGIRPGLSRRQMQNVIDAMRVAPRITGVQPCRCPGTCPPTPPCPRPTGAGAGTNMT